MNDPNPNQEAFSQSTRESDQRRDLSFLWPVIDRIRAVEIKFDGDALAQVNAAGGIHPDVEARLAKLEAEIAAMKEVVQNAAGVLNAVGAAADAASSAAPHEYPAHSWKAVTATIVFTVALLLVAHWLIVVVYDMKLLVLRLASIVLPLGIALAFTVNRRIVLRYEVPVAIVIALLAVFGMSYVTAVVEKTTWLPENAREWRETIEYVASIALAYVTGVLVSSAWQAHVGRATGRVGETTLKMAQSLAKVSGHALDTGSKVGKQVKTIHDLINTAMPAATAVASVITGVNSVLG